MRTYKVRTAGGDLIYAQGHSIYFGRHGVTIYRRRDTKRWWRRSKDVILFAPYSGLESIELEAS